MTTKMFQNSSKGREIIPQQPLIPMVSLMMSNEQTNNEKNRSK